MQAHALSTLPAVTGSLCVLQLFKELYSLSRILLKADEVSVKYKSSVGTRGTGQSKLCWIQVTYCDIWW